MKRKILIPISFLTLIPAMTFIQSCSTRPSESWTVLVYMCGSDLESDGSCATGDLDEMKRANLHDNVNLLIETGGSTRWDTPGISSDHNQYWQIKNGKLDKLQDLTTNNMADPDTLQNFISWGINTYQTDNYALVMWDHGGGCWGAEQDSITGGIMTLTQMHSAISNGLSATNIQKFNFLGFDACLMADLETLYTLSNFTNYFVTSEETEPGYGWDYTPWLNYLSLNSLGSNTENICKSIVDSYYEFYAPYMVQDARVTLSVQKSDHIDAVINSFVEWCSTLTDCKSDLKTLMTNDLNVGKFSYGDGYGFADLISLTNLIPKTDNYDPNSQEAWALRKEIDDAVVYNKYLQGSAFQNNPSTGISIYSLNGESSHSATNYVNLWSGPQYSMFSNWGQLLS